MSIRIFYDEINFRLRGWKKIGEFIKKVISEEEKISGDLNFILTNDKNVREINRKFLKRNYYTDIISFNYCKDDIVSGDIYISIERVKINSKNYKVSYKEELLRVMIHGVLHLLGHDDKRKKQILKMRELENKWLKRYYQ